jgi:hypothetical protein
VRQKGNYTTLSRQIPFWEVLIADFFSKKKAAERKLSKHAAKRKIASASKRFQWSTSEASSSAVHFTEIAKPGWTASPPTSVSRARPRVPNRTDIVGARKKFGVIDLA